jgi:hypothetical protein
MGGVVCCVLYGDYPAMHARFLRGLERGVPPDVEIFVGLNAVGNRSLSELRKAAWPAGAGDDPAAWRSAGDLRAGRYRLFTDKNANRLKYPVMREMFAKVGTDDWTLWLDDDTMLPDSTSWWSELCQMMAAGVDYTGVEYFMWMQGGQPAFIITRPWYRGIPLRRKCRKPVFLFYTGSFWALSARARQALRWPDPALVHNGGDTLLGEAVRQNNFRRKAFPCRRFGIKINSMPRRGHRERPAGAG